MMTSSFWDNLLAYIDRQRVIPIIGSELLTVDDAGVQKPLPRYIAERLGRERGIPTDDLHEVVPLNDVVWRCQQARVSREVIYKRIKELATDTTIAIPESLRKLARIRHFKLFVTTTFDSLLERAVNEVRTPEKAQVFTYTPTGLQHLPADLQKLKGPIIYHLLGRASPVPDDYAVTEEDTLEFLSSLLDQNNRPKPLFDALKAHHLLIIGSTFPDWLARFFIRVAKGERLSLHREQVFLADGLAGCDQNLVIFLERFTNQTTDIFEKGADEFITELWERYSQAHPADEAAPAFEPDGASDSVAPKPRIFLSYASQDGEIARTICNTLKDLGWDVWFDKLNLNPGVHWDSKIKTSIHECVLFLPVVSANTQQRAQGYFRLEWNEAADWSKRYDESVPFLVPLLIDKTLEAEKALVPAEFRKVQWYRLDQGEITGDFQEKMKQLLREHQKKEKKGPS